MIEPRRYPGWYLDPSNQEIERFWNGESWTELTRTAPRLSDYLGPIEPVLLRILGDQDPTHLVFGNSALFGQRAATER